MLNDVTFERYHMFRAKSRMLTGFSPHKKKNQYPQNLSDNRIGMPEIDDSGFIFITPSPTIHTLARTSPRARAGRAPGPN
jgi:hypothetical protein